MFKSLPYCLSAEKSDAVQYLFYKSHQTREKDPRKPENRTLFVVALPAFLQAVRQQAYSDYVKTLFSCFGQIDDVIIQPSPGASITPVGSSKFFDQTESAQGHQVAYVVYAKSSSVKVALTKPLNDPVSVDSKTLVVGMKKWCSDYASSIPDEKALEAEVEQFVNAYDVQKAKEKEQAKAKLNQPDEEGWITVTREGKKPGIRRTDVIEEKIKARAKKKDKELLNFYTFQVRESKMKHLNELRQKFEEDKKRIALMKNARKFKPY